MLREKKKQVEILAKELLVKEVLFQSDVEALIGKRPFEEKKALEPEHVGRFLREYHLMIVMLPTNRYTKNRADEYFSFKRKYFKENKRGVDSFNASSFYTK